MTREPRILLGALLALLLLAFGSRPGETAASKASASPSKRGAKQEPIARVADRTVEEADIRRAALVMANDPLRVQKPALWRKKLLELCVDRVLLGIEAERAGVRNNPEVKRRIERASSELLYAEIRDRYLIPEATPTTAQLDTARAGGLYRKAKLSYILSVTDREMTYVLYEKLRKGARFDSLAPLFSVHPSASKGGDLGWRRVGSLNAQSWHAFGSAKPGDLLGPYANASSHEIYRVEAIENPSDAELREVMTRDRTLEMDTRYNIGLLRRYGFKLDPEEVSAYMFAAATEPADSILMSLDSEGKRPKRGVKPSLGVIASADGDSITYPDIAALIVRSETGKGSIENSQDLLMLCTVAAMPRLIAKDAAARGIDRDPDVARRLQLVRDEVSTRALVATAVPALDSTALRAFYKAHSDRYRRPAARRALVAMFAAEDTARMARAGWARKSFRDSVISSQAFRTSEQLSVSTLFPRFHGEVSLFATDQDPLSVAGRSLSEGQVSPVIRMPNGYAVALGLGSEPSRAYTYDEVLVRVRTEARENAENAWVVKRLERLRAATPARTAPALLNAVPLGTSSETGGKRR